MRFEHLIVIEAPRERIRAFLDDVPATARCIPGLEEVREVEPDTYEGRMRVKIGPLGLNIGGRARLDRSQGADVWGLHGEGRDARAGSGARASLTARLEELGPHSTEVAIAADVQFTGRLGELGQPLIKRKAGSMVEEFGENLRRALERP